MFPHTKLAVIPIHGADNDSKRIQVVLIKFILTSWNSKRIGGGGTTRFCLKKTLLSSLIVIRFGLAMLVTHVDANLFDTKQFCGFDLLIQWKASIQCWINSIIFSGLCLVSIHIFLWTSGYFVLANTNDPAIFIRSISNWFNMLLKLSSYISLLSKHDVNLTFLLTPGPCACNL